MNIQPIIKAAHAGGAILKNYYGQVLDVKEKSNPTDLQTKADLESEAAILTSLQKDFPSYGFLSEERGEIKKNSEWVFVVDPLDGTNNFCLGIPNFTVSIGLFHKDRLVAGVIHAPLVDQTYHAVAGDGAYLGKRRLKVNGVTDIKHASVSYAEAYDYFFEAKFVDDLYKNLDVRRVALNWSIAFDYCLLAAGRIESVIFNKIELHDFAAGKLIAREAGAVLTDFAGHADSDRNDQFIASNNEIIHKEILGAVDRVFVSALAKKP